MKLDGCLVTLVEVLYFTNEGIRSKDGCSLFGMEEGMRTSPVYQCSAPHVYFPFFFALPHLPHYWRQSFCPGLENVSAELLNIWQAF